MENELGANPWQGYKDAEIAEHLAAAMKDLPEDFDDLLNDIKQYAGRRSLDGYEAFRSDLYPEIEKVQGNGEQLAREVMGAAVDVDRADADSSEGFETAWRDVPDPRFEATDSAE